MCGGTSSFKHTCEPDVDGTTYSKVPNSSTAQVTYKLGGPACALPVSPKAEGSCALQVSPQLSATWGIDLEVMGGGSPGALSEAGAGEPGAPTPPPELRGRGAGPTSRASATHPGVRTVLGARLPTWVPRDNTPRS